MAPPTYGTILSEKQLELPLYNPQNLRSSPNTQDWMAGVDDDTLMSALSLPGTHDSAAYTSIWPFVSTQKMDIQQQLDAGIRYFDLRCGLVKDQAEMVHGTALLGLLLEGVLSTMYTWLDQHPTEALIVQIKQDRRPEDSEISFPEAIIKTLHPQPQYWRTAATTPTLGALRGRIQLFRRFTGRLRSYGIDVTRWQDNPPKPFTIHTWHGVQLTVQDHYSFSDPEPLPSLVVKKGGDVAGLLDAAAADPDPARWYINYASAFEFNVYYTVPPREVALGGWWNFRWVDGINIRLFGYLTQRAGMKRRARYGIVAMDFPERPEADLVKRIISTNFGGEKTAVGSWAKRVGVGLLLFLFALLVCSFCSVVYDGRAWCPSFLHACSPAASA